MKRDTESNTQTMPHYSYIVIVIVIVMPASHFGVGKRERKALKKIDETMQASLLLFLSLYP